MFSFKGKTVKLQVVSGIIVLLVIYTMFTYVTSLFAFISPSREMRWDGTIQSINKPTFTAGETVTINGYLEEGESFLEKDFYYFFTYSENIRWILVVIDPNNMPIWIQTDQINNAQEDISLNPINFNIPPNPSLGVYRVRLIVWTDWLPSGETRINLVYEETFEVI